MKMGNLKKGWYVCESNFIQWRKNYRIWMIASKPRAFPSKAGNGRAKPAAFQVSARGDRAFE